MPHKSFSTRAMLIALLAVFFALAACGYWVARGTPRAVAEGASDRVQCMSYAPFRKPGESPFIEETIVSEARLREDLTLLSARTGCVRTYSVQQGLHAVPKVARELGMKVMLGVWLGRNRVENELELEKGIELAKQYPDTVRWSSATRCCCGANCRNRSWPATSTLRASRCPCR
jgi:glucan 1,3-beta-glucosidase